MKKLLIPILLLFLASCAVQKPQKSRELNFPFPGTVPNDGSGTPLRDAINMINDNFLTVRDSMNWFREELIDTVSHHTIAPIWDDSTGAKPKLMTWNLTENLIESMGGGSGAKYYLQFRVDTTTGAPAAGDSIFTQTSFIGKRIFVSKNGEELILRDKSYYVPKTFDFNSTTGAVTVHPKFVTNDAVIITVYNSSEWTNLSIEGEESGLLDYLRAYWALDETTGTYVNDSHASYDGTTNATVNSDGKIGRAETFNGTNGRVELGASVGDIGTSDFSLSVWVYTTKSPLTGNQGIMGCWGTAPYWYVYLYNGNPTGCLNFGSGNEFWTGNGAITASAWHHIAITVDRSDVAKIYVDGAVQTETYDCSAFSATDLSNANTFNIGNPGNALTDWYFTGRIDEAALFIGYVLTQDDITALYNSGAGWAYPFTE